MISFSLAAQNLPYQTVTRNGVTYYEYKVQPGEGLYAVSRTFSVPVAEILRCNPDAKKGLLSGQKLLIPILNDQKDAPPPRTRNEAQPPSSSADQNLTFKHTVSRGETVYGIAKMYHTSEKELYRYNPDAQSGLKAGQILTIPQRRVISEEKEENYRYHTIQPGETFYSVARTYSLTPQDVKAANPGLTVETFRVGKTIRVPFFESYELIAPYEKQTTNIIHKVLPGETLFGIARKYQVDMGDIERKNPSLVGGLRADVELIIPMKKIDIDRDARDEIKAAERLLSQIGSEKIDRIKVALLFPFLDEKGNGHWRLQEYYEGFLLALQEMKSKGADVELYVFEIGKGGDTRKLESLLGTMEMQSLDLIVGGVTDAQIKIISDFSRANNIKYVIPFSQNDSEVLGNGNIFQINPSPMTTYDHAAQTFQQNFRFSEVVFIHTGKNDKTEFVGQLQNILRENRQRYETLPLSDDLDSTLFVSLRPDQKKILIPTSGDSESLRILLQQLKELQSSHSTYNIRLFGYPEWQTYASLIRDYHAFKTSIFTPFFVDLQDPRTKKFYESFEKWYRRRPLETHPCYAMWGYDTALFFLTALQSYGLQFEQRIRNISVPSLQFAFDFERTSNWGGFVNKGLFYICYETDGSITKTYKSQ